MLDGVLYRLSVLENEQRYTNCGYRLSQRHLEAVCVQRIDPASLRRLAKRSIPDR
jgi:hypothetical protein